MDEGDIMGSRTLNNTHTSLVAGSQCFCSGEVCWSNTDCIFYLLLIDLSR